MSKFLIALFTAMLIAVIGGMVSPAEAHHCGCQVDNSGHGSTSSGTSGSGESGSGESGSGESGTTGSNSGTGDGEGCVSNSGEGNAGGDNSGEGNADDECPPPDDPDENPGGDSGDNPGSDSSDTSDSGDSAADSGVQVLGAQASVASSSDTQGAVPTAVNAGLRSDTEESSSTVAALMILLGLALIGGATVRRRTHT